MRYIKNIFLLFVFIFSVMSVTPVHSQKELLSVMDDFEAKAEWLDYRLALEQWELYTTGEADSLEFYTGLYNHLISDDKLQAALKTIKPDFDNEDDLRRFQLIKNAVLSGEIELHPDIVQLKDSLSNLNILYRATFENKETLTNDLYRIYRTDNSRSRREEAYRAYVSVGSEMHEGLERLIKLRNQKAKKLGYNSYLGLALSYQDINVTDYMNMLRMLDTLSETAYSKILASVKSKIRLTDPEIWDLAYAYQDINRQIDSYFPADSQIVYVKRALKDIGYDIEKLPIYFDLDSRPGKSQFAYAFTIKAPYDMRVLANITDGFLSTKTLMHEVGHALHSAYINQDQAVFSNTMIDGIWAEGMAQTVALLMLDREWLQEYAHVPANIAESFLESEKEQQLIYLRTTLLRLHFEMEIYKNPNRDLNELYWDLFEKYLKLPKHTDIYPWASIIHYTTHPVYLHNYLYADMIAAQNISFLRENYGSLVKNLSCRSFLTQNYFRFGAKYDWRELLKRGTDEELKIEYFKTQVGL